MVQTSNNPRNHVGNRQLTSSTRGARANQKAVSKTVYKDNTSQCIFITSRKSRCKRCKEANSEYCKYHSTDKLKPYKGGALPAKNSDIKIHEYDYYKEDPDEFDSTAAYVSSGVWIGSIDSIHDPEFLKKHGIKSILNTSGMEPNLKTLDMYKTLGIDYYTLSKSEYNPRTRKHRVVKFLGDEPFSLRFTPRDFYKWLHQGAKIMEKAKKPMITNCHMGMNRSASVIASYLMTKPHPLTYNRTMEVLERANHRRNLKVLTNKDFRTSLRYYPVFAGTAEKDKNGVTKQLDPKEVSLYKSYIHRYE